MSDSGDTYPGPDDSEEETVGEALADYLGLVEETIRTQVTDEDIRARIRHAMDLAESAQSTEPEQARSNDDFGDRRVLLDTLVAMMRDPQKPVVLAAPGGTGKTTAATALAGRAREMGHHVWWVSAADPVTLSRDLTAIAEQLGDVNDVNAIAWDEPDGADRFWRLLDNARTKWLLVFDEADDPAVLATSSSPAGVQDLTGWVRSSARGLALVTSRETDPRMWVAAQLLRLGALQELDAAQILLELAPSAGDADQALALARRLDRHPLSLRLAGSYLRSHAAQAPTFAAYERILDEQARSDLYGRSTAMPMTLALEVSLEELARQGIPQTRPVLQVASCYAPAPIPASLLNARALAETNLFPGPGSPAPVAGNGAEEALRELVASGIFQPADNGILLHTAIIEAERDSLDEPASASAGIRHAAIKILYDCASRLPHDDPASWPQYLLLGPHLLSLLDTSVGHVDREHFGLLMETTARAVGVFNMCGAGQAGIVLGERALTRSAEREDEQRAVLRVRHAMTWAVADRGDRSLAENLYRENLQVRMRVLGPEDPDVLLTRHELAWIAACQGDLATAETRYRDTLRDSIRVLGLDEPRTMLTRHELAWAIANQGPDRLGEAREMLDAVLRDRQRVLGSEHHRTLTTLHELAWITAKEGRWEEAESAYRELLGMCLRRLGEDHQVTMVLRHELAWIAARRGRIGEAESLYRDLLAQRRRILGEKHPETRDTQTALEELRRGRIVDASHLT